MPCLIYSAHVVHFMHNFSQDLHHFTKIEDPDIICWALLSELAIFLDILPGYRITLVDQYYSKEEKRKLLSKDVRELRTFEKNLLNAYEAFLGVVKRYASQGIHQHASSKNKKQYRKMIPFYHAVGDSSSKYLNQILI